MKARLSAEERRRQIVEAAVDLFSRKGFRGTRTREIAAAAGISEAMVFRHFATKRELYFAIIETKSATEELLASAAIVARTRDDAGVLRAVGLKMIEQTESDPSLMRLLLFSALEGHELSDIFFESRVKRLHEFLGNYIRKGIKEGRFRSMNPLVAARGFIGMIVHYLLIHELFGVKRPARSSPEEVVEQFVSIFLKGIER
ncbi:HTH-type transcriptional regulator AcrR [Candidatus Methylomirabilis lanthanidiphila]|uniref:HTH-type transcriptional regulator AcrR n=1 Tax=Candidatus Methylomirabilis lanthanidiphila TaxID=2211376 RepID=A0A564ZIA5_9BACT|nr:TetR/AcrR family transcriptional regulator [Candidatus Methylomirabilis lanthanidiphila]VUZ85035.1 HTH-type transcriptional regulator AcrR [Candidatus Methylomirabilis lanthanidiphila]